MYAKLLAAAAGLILGSVAVLAGDNSNSRIPDHQPRQTGTDPPLPFPMRSEPGVGKPDGPSRLAGSNLLPPVPRSFW